MNTFNLIIRWPLFILFHNFNFPKILPFNYTLLLSTKCNSRCKTCNIWKQVRDELTLDEWEKILKSIGTSPYWITISGGEPFLSSKIVDFVKLCNNICRPAIINIPTNSLLVSKIRKDVERILNECPNLKLVINLSLDGVGKLHDEIRGIPGSFEKFEQNYQNLKQLKNKYPNLTVGIHSVISRFNVKYAKELIDYAFSLKPDQFISEIAENRVELENLNLKITPTFTEYSSVIDYLIEKIKKQNFSGIALFSESFRQEYYKFVKKWLKKERIKMADFAGWASCEITSWGEVWPSCIKGENLGNLRAVNYDFKKIWFGEKAKSIRKKIKKQPSSFPLANAFYSSALFDLPILFKVFKNLTINKLFIYFKL